MWGGRGNNLIISKQWKCGRAPDKTKLQGISGIQQQPFTGALLKNAPKNSAINSFSGKIEDCRPGMY